MGLQLALKYSIFFTVISINAEKVRYDGDQLWRLIPENENQLQTLINLSALINKVDVWKAPTRIDKAVDVRVSSTDIKTMRQHFVQKGMKVTVLIDDLQELIDDHTRDKRSIAVTKATSLATFDYENYHTAQEIEEWMDFAVLEYAYVSKFQIGVTYEGRPINALKISKSGSNTSNPSIYVDSLMHSREWVATASMVYIFKEILTNSSYSWMTENMDWYFVPMVNVDGYIYTWTTDRLWRKTRSGQGTLRCFGVDPNRNFNDHWNGPDGSSSEPCSSIYRGQFPESESENRHLARFISEHSNSIKAVITVHSYAQMILYPYNFDLGEYPSNNDEQNTTARAMSEAMYRVHNVTYEYGSAAETLAVATGVTTDWTQKTAHIDINFTIELRDTGTYGFVLPADQIIPTGEELLEGFVVLAEHVQTKENRTSESL